MSAGHETSAHPKESKSAWRPGNLVCARAPPTLDYNPFPHTTLNPKNLHPKPMGGGRTGCADPKNLSRSKLPPNSRHNPAILASLRVRGFNIPYLMPLSRQSLVLRASFFETLSTVNLRCSAKNDLCWPPSTETWKGHRPQTE